MHGTRIRDHTPGARPAFAYANQPSRDRRPLLPETLEAIRCQLGIAHGVLDVLMAEIGLQRPCVVPCIGEGEAAGMAQHVREEPRHTGMLAEPLEVVAPTLRCHRAVALAPEHERRCLLLAAQAA